MPQYFMRLLFGLCVAWAMLFFGAAQAAGWTATGTMSEARYQHTATLLDNGKVLVAGGRDVREHASTVLYDPVTQLWRKTGAMPEARYDHTATLLANGKVLIAGGTDGRVLASAALYDPATGRWTATGAMPEARRNHTATLLANGKVLVAGGFGLDQFASAVLYDPATGLWAETGAMPEARTDHTATLLANGKVLVAGGHSGNALASAALYDPVTGLWTATGAMPGTRTEHTATLLPNGKVLVVGGRNHIGLLVSLASAALYDPATDLWEATGAMPEAITNHTATLLTNGQVLVVGGNDGDNYNLATVLYNPITSTWTTSATLTQERGYHTTTLLTNGKLLAVGGRNYYRSLATAELYTPDTGTANDPDFVVTTIAVSPTGPTVNTAFTATVTVKNQGKTAGDGGQLLVWTHQATTPLCGAIADQLQAIGILAAGASKTLTFTGLKSSKTGTKTFRAFADGRCDTLEKTETNNQKTLSYRVRSTQADFTVSAISLNPVIPTANKAFTANVTVTNYGMAAGNAGFLDAWLDQPTVQDCGAEGDAWVGVGNLAAGASKTVNLKLVAGAAGTKTLRAFADSWCETTEPAESNNQVTKSYTTQ